MEHDSAADIGREILTPELEGCPAPAVFCACMCSDGQRGEGRDGTGGGRDCCGGQGSVQGRAAAEAAAKSENIVRADNVVSAHIHASRASGHSVVQRWQTPGVHIDLQTYWV